MVNADPEFEMLCEIDKWRFIAFIMLELQYQKPIPLDEDYLKRKGFDIKKRSMSLTVEMLHKNIEVVTEGGAPIIDGSGCIYFVQAENASIKIGHSKHLPRRIGEIRRVAGQKIQFIFAHKGTIQTENTYHEKFKSYRIAPEWYTPDQSLWDFIKQLQQDPTITNVTEDFTSRTSGVTQRKSRVYKEEEDKEEEEVYAVTPNAFKDYWNKTRLPKIRSLTEQRRKQLKIRMSEDEFAKQWMVIIDKMAASDFCNGENDRIWKADIDWLLKNDTYYNRVLEGKYDNKAKDKTPLEKMAEAKKQWGGK